MPAFNSKRFLCGEFKYPRQMLGDQTYDGHLSIHDDNMAADPGADGPQGDSTYQNQLNPTDNPSHDSEMGHDQSMSDDNMAADPGADGPQGDSTYQNQLDPAHNPSHDSMNGDTDMGGDSMHNQHDDNDM